MVITLNNATHFFKIPSDSLFLIFKGISFHSLNKKYDERNWPLPHRDLSLNPQIVGMARLVIMN